MEMIEESPLLFEDDNELKLKTINFTVINRVNLHDGSLKHIPEYEKCANVPFNLGEIVYDEI